MDKQRNLVKNLEALWENNGQSLAEFAKEAGIPKSTLQTVRLSGSTTLNTAIKISDALGIPLDRLAGGGGPAEKMDVTEHMLRSAQWLQSLPRSEQEKAVSHFRTILEVICT